MRRNLCSRLISALSLAMSSLWTFACCFKVLGSNINCFPRFQHTCDFQSSGQTLLDVLILHCLMGTQDKMVGKSLAMHFFYMLFLLLGSLVHAERAHSALTPRQTGCVECSSGAPICPTCPSNSVCQVTVPLDCTSCPVAYCADLSGTLTQSAISSSDRVATRTATVIVTSTVWAASKSSASEPTAFKTTSQWWSSLRLLLPTLGVAIFMARVLHV
ncbi:hypothetical protein BD289DRAFT_247756 [Coniella lustricola]|uniref:Membrane anchor Opy2 N-terminal domain-containing protein n=1 Tax=Coniella lustricola TaxID=2025994 RepID=A0A2T3A8V8_9PEZI|nr:hypothetical protein BD289DRAFT_247756 [Coniella lustricola]